MGLAAAQARLLTITTRKSECDFQSMQLSHQKISLARDMDKITDAYESALRADTLKYDYYGSGGKELNLSYGLLMTPSIYNDYYPKLLTDSSKRVVLDNAIAAAAKYAGIPAEGYCGTPSSDVRDAFIEGLYNAGVISMNTGNNILNTNYGNTIGLGDTVTVSNFSENLSYKDVLELIKDYTTSTGDYGYELGTNANINDSTIEIQYGSEKTNFLSRSYEHVWQSTKSTGKTQFTGYDYDSKIYSKNGSSNTDNVDIGLYELLTDSTQYSLVLSSPDGYAVPLNEIAYLQRSVVGSDGDASFLNWITDQFISILGSSEENLMAIQYAYDAVRDLVYPDNDVMDASVDMQDKIYKDLTRKSKTTTTSTQVTMVSNTWEYYVGSTTTKVGKWTSERYTTGIRNKDSASGRTYSDKTYQQIAQNAATKLHETSAKSSQYSNNTYTESINLCFSNWGSSSVKGKAANHDPNVAKSYATTLASESTQYVGIVYSQDNSGLGSCAAVNLNNLAKVFVTAFVDFAEGNPEDYKYGYKLGKKSDCNLYDGRDTYGFNVQYDDSAQQNGALEAHFYDALLNQICVNGWTMNERITDDEYMQEMLKNGMYFISSMSDDGQYFQEYYASNKLIVAKPESDAVSKAEAKYNTEKAKIQSNEEAIDKKLKILSNEVTALNTEYDTIKNLIKTNVDKGFKRYTA